MKQHVIVVPSDRLIIVDGTPLQFDFPAPRTKRSVRLGVPLVPSHSAHPVGMVLAEPDHMPMKPVGTASSSRFRSCGSAISAPPNGPPS